MLLAVLGGAFGGAFMAWAAMFLLWPTTGIDDALTVILVAFAVGGGGAGLWSRRRARRVREP
jgi:hypothetical protein